MSARSPRRLFLKGRNEDFGRSALAFPEMLKHRPAAKLLAVAIVLVAAWHIVAATTADTLAVENPRAALNWSPNHAAALVALANEIVDNSDETEQAPQGSAGASEEEGSLDSEPPPSEVAQVEALAQRALWADPLETEALKLLALVADTRADNRKGAALMKIVSERSQRDITIQSWLMTEHLYKGEIAEALQNADTMLRSWPESEELVTPLLVSLASDPDVMPVVAEAVEKNPPWRERFLVGLPQELEVEPLEAFYARLLEGPSPPNVAELKAFLSRLIELWQPERALAIRQSVPPNEEVAAGLVNNGGFELPISGLPFGWSIEPIRGASTSVVSENASNRVLRLRFFNTRVPYRNVSQLLLLSPGAYSFVGRVRASALDNERGLQWSISCAYGNKQTITETQRFNGSSAWTAFAVSFDVPNDDACRAQVLRLALPARVPAEQEISGEIWFDDLQVQKSPAPSAG